MDPAPEENLPGKPWVLILVAAISGGALSGGGVSLGVQSEIGALKEDVSELRSVVNQFMISGPTEVRKSLAKLETRLETISESNVKQERYQEELLSRHSDR